MAVRKLVSEAELMLILSERLRQAPIGEDATVGGVLRLREPDGNGCNWIPDVELFSSVSPLYEIVGMTRSEFNLQDE